MTENQNSGEKNKLATLELTDCNLFNHGLPEGKDLSQA